jgi:hypothetical protein
MKKLKQRPRPKKRAIDGGVVVWMDGLLLGIQYFKGCTTPQLYFLQSLEKN